MISIPILSEPRSPYPTAPSLCHRHYFLTPEAMYLTRQTVFPLVTPHGVIGDIPTEAWDRAVALAKDAFGVRLAVERHDDPSDPIAHYHFYLAGDSAAIDESLDAIATEVARVLAAHTSKVTVPEGR